MAEEPSSADETPITFHIKSSADAKYVVTVPLTTTVADLKQKLSTSEYADIPADRQRLIYSGRVLKDPDTLASYKIKEGNTIHLVKGAASNQRQNPANQPSSSSNTTGTPAQGAQGVPQNLAAGTGRDPLAALTGARYAGFAQMPNASMFGPDGGMGPPPDPENLASMLENPNFASTFNEALSNPDVIEQMIRSNPMFQGPMGQQARQMLQDPNFRRMLTDPTTLRQMNEMRRTMPRVFGGLGGMGAGGGGFPMPGATDTTQPAAGEDAQTGNSTATQVPEGNGPQSPPPNPLAMLGAPGATGGAGANPFAALFGPTGGAAAPTAQGQNQAGGNNAEGTRQARDGAQSQQQPPQLGPQANPFGAMAQQLLQNPQMMQSMLAAMVPPQPNNSDNNDNNNSSNRSAPGQAGAPSFNPLAALMALQQMGGGENPFGAFGDFGGAGAGAGGAGSAAAAPADTRPPEDRYAEQLRQLNEMGFYEFERNVEALRRTGGSVQGAVEYLLTH